MNRRNYLIAGALAWTIPAAAHAADVQITAQNPIVELSVSEQINSAPDTASFSTGVETKARTASEALRENSRQAKVVVDRLKAFGIAEKDIQTTGINLNANYEYDQGSRQNRFVGYRVSNQVRATVRDIAKLGPILDGIVSSGATNLSGPYFSVENDKELKNLARERALANAKSRAENYARIAGYSGVRILSINEGISGVSQGPTMMRAESMAAPPPPPPPVAVGQVGTTVSLNITYEMTR